MASDERTYTEAEVTERLDGLPGWSHRSGAIRRTYTTDGWLGTLLVVNAIGFLCEAAGHHPDLAVSWSRVEVALTTHSAKGITAKDFETAELIERTVLWAPEAESPLRGPPKPFVR